MDAFSLALIYGMNKLERKREILLSIIVGIYHFIMPYLGNNIGSIIFRYIPVNPNIIVTAIFMIIGIEMILDKKEEFKINGILDILLFGLAVSIDSFGAGIGLNYLTNHTILSIIYISIISFILTYIGLVFGKYISIKLGKISNIIGGIVLILLSIIYIFK